MAFTAADVKTLREMTGVGMLDCKKALAETDGDMDKAVELLREKVDDLPTLFSVDLLNLDTCKYQLILEDIRDYGREI